MNKFTIGKAVQNEIVIEKSRFICTLAKVATEAEAQNFIKEKKKQYWDATHNCSAYIIGKTSQAERSNDDGEPSGTAGVPMLTALRSKEVYNVVAVVTRYFGGVKLGAGGLIRAYAHSVGAALQEAGLAQVVVMGKYSFTRPLDQVGKVLNLLYTQSLFQVAEVLYEAAGAKVILIMEASKQQEAEQLLTELLSGTITLEQEEIYDEERLL